MTPINSKAKKIPAKKIFEKNALKKYQSRPELFFQIFDTSYETRVILLKTNLEKKKARFLTTQIFRDEIEENKVNHKNNAKQNKYKLKELGLNSTLPTEIKC